MSKFFATGWNSDMIPTSPRKIAHPLQCCAARGSTERVSLIYIACDIVQCVGVVLDTSGSPTGASAIL
jgi:hypothetical protein